MTAAPEAKYTVQTVLWVKQHNPKLITFAIERPEAFRFSAGQFARLGVREGEGYLWRAYSILSPEYGDTLEFVAVLIDDGAMSAHLATLKAGDTLLLDKTATGFLLPGRFADGDTLVLLSTGSGIAPFIAMLQMPEIWQRFQQIIITHSVSQSSDLIFNDFFTHFAEHPLVGEHAPALTYLPITTRETGEGLHQRLPELIANGNLEAASKQHFSPDNTRFMLCGNPAMVKDTFQALLNQGYTMHRNREPGQIIMENGF